PPGHLRCTVQSFNHKRTVRDHRANWTGSTGGVLANGVKGLQGCLGVGSALTTLVPGQMNLTTTGFGGVAGPYSIFYQFILRDGSHFTTVWHNTTGPLIEGFGTDPGLTSPAPGSPYNGLGGSTSVPNYGLAAADGCRVRLGHYPGLGDERRSRPVSLYPACPTTDLCSGAHDRRATGGLLASKQEILHPHRGGRGRQFGSSRRDRLHAGTALAGGPQ